MSESASTRNGGHWKKNKQKEKKNFKSVPTYYSLSIIMERQEETILSELLKGIPPKLSRQFQVIIMIIITKTNHNPNNICILYIYIIKINNNKIYVNIIYIYIYKDYKYI